jgi:hypothetical protein
MVNAIYINNDGDSATDKFSIEKLRYDFTFADWLLGASDTLSSYAFVVSGDIVKSSESQSGGVCSVFIAGGTIGASASVTCNVTTSAGRIKSKKLVFYII